MHCVAQEETEGALIYKLVGLGQVDRPKVKQCSFRTAPKQQPGSHEAITKNDNLFNYEGSGEDTSLGELRGSQSTQSVLTSQGDGLTLPL